MRSTGKHTKEFKEFLRKLPTLPAETRKRLISRRKQDRILRLQMGPREVTEEDEGTPWGAVVEGLLRGDPWGLISMRVGVSLEYIRFVRDEADLGREALMLGRLAGEIHGVGG